MDKSLDLKKFVIIWLSVRQFTEFLFNCSVSKAASVSAVASAINTNSALGSCALSKSKRSKFDVACAVDVQ